MNGKISNFQQVASIRRYTLTGGRGKGLDVLDCDNGNIRFLLNVSKALDLMQVYHQGQNVSFLSKNAFVKDNLPFLNRFEGGMLYTCGLDSVGGREGFEIHGSLHNTQAEVHHVECDEKGIAIEATIKNTALFGKNLTLKRRVTSKVGADNLTIEDTVVNDGYLAQEYCLLYHVNVGYPMLDAGGKIIMNVDSIIPRNDYAKENIDSVFTTCEPKADEQEVCYFIKNKDDKVEYVNEKIGKKFTLRYSKETLPCLVEWKSMVSGDYALGLEPCTTELDDRFNYSILQAGQSINFKLDISIEKK